LLIFANADDYLDVTVESDGSVEKMNPDTTVGKV
jgi:hypothetical protein